MATLFKREIMPALLNLARHYPVIGITGPRQSGKTTTAKAAFPSKPYVNLEEMDVRELALNDPRRFLAQFPKGVIIDEIQHAPELLSFIQTIVDEAEEPGLFILTGSHQLELQQAISQSLAGRIALLELLPLTLSEIKRARLNYNVDEYLLNGFYPRVYKDKLNSTTAYSNYVRTYLERDVKQLLHVKDLNTFRKFIRLCAGRIGQVLNYASLANDVGISSHTVKHWLSILEASYIVFTLQPYYENFGKRLIKSPKLYFYDVGLASYLLGIETPGQISRDPLRGALFENLVVVDCIKTRLNRGKEPRFYYYRDNNQNEVDMIYQIGHNFIPIEIKSSETYHREFFKNLVYFRQLVGKRFIKGLLVYAGKLEQVVNDNEIVNYQHVSKIIDSANDN